MVSPFEKKKTKRKATQNKRGEKEDRDREVESRNRTRLGKLSIEKREGDSPEKADMARRKNRRQAEEKTKEERKDHCIQKRGTQESLILLLRTADYLFLLTSPGKNLGGGAGEPRLSKHSRKEEILSQLPVPACHRDRDLYLKVKKNLKPSERSKKEKGNRIP